MGSINCCPFDHALARRIVDAHKRVSAGSWTETHFDDEHTGMTAVDCSKADDKQAAVGGLVVTHGDACLPKFDHRRRRFSGFIDCGRLGVADRYQDLALAARSIAYNLGMSWVEPFFLRYGVNQLDPSKLAFYRLLDEFF